jgi:hypothetical protein
MPPAHNATDGPAAILSTSSLIGSRVPRDRAATSDSSYRMLQAGRSEHHAPPCVMSFRTSETKFSGYKVDDGLLFIGNLDDAGFKPGFGKQFHGEITRELLGFRE